MRLQKALLVLLIVLLPLSGLLTAQNAAPKDTGKSLVNINTAVQADLEKLPGIGSSCKIPAAISPCSFDNA